MADPFEVNFFGVVKVTNAFLPHMRSRRDGTIVVIGSRSVYFNQFPVSFRCTVWLYGICRSADAHARKQGRR